MKKRGFTLAEMLLAMATIGIIAALTLPALKSNVIKNQIGPSLLKAVNTLENANRMILVDNNLRRLDTVCGNNYLSDKCIPKYVKGSANGVGASYQKYTGGNLFSVSSGDGFVSDDTIAYFQNPASTNTINTNMSSYSGTYYTIYIDINGPVKGPNMLGKDIFKFLVDMNGALIPVGGTLYSKYDSSAGGILWKTACKDPKTMGDGSACAGAVADNGWSAVYID